MNTCITVLKQLYAHYGTIVKTKWNVNFLLTSTVDDEIFLVLWCDVEPEDQLVHTNMNYFCVSRPNEVDGKGLFDCLEGSLCRLGIQAIAIDDEQCRLLIGIGTDGEYANIATNECSDIDCLSLFVAWPVLHVQKNVPILVAKLPCFTADNRVDHR